MGTPLDTCFPNAIRLGFHAPGSTWRPDCSRARGGENAIPDRPPAYSPGLSITRLAGSCTDTVVPCAASHTIFIMPPCSSTNRFVSGSPSPILSNFRGNLLSIGPNSDTASSNLSRGMPVPVSETLISRPPSALRVVVCGALIYCSNCSICFAHARGGGRPASVRPTSEHPIED